MLSRQKPREVASSGAFAFLNLGLTEGLAADGRIRQYSQGIGKCAEGRRMTDMSPNSITLWHGGGKTTAGNCQMLCKMCNRTKSGK